MGTPGSAANAGQKLDNVGLPGDAKAKGAQRKSSPDQRLGAGFNFRRVRLLVEQFTLGGEEVLLPLLLQVNQRPAPLAEGEMLEAGEREEILFCVHTVSLAAYARPSMKVMPPGSVLGSGGTTV
jgi:hypothetical protein